MKTDRFSDIIRRKLESIRPEFSDKDWARMQSSLQTGIPQPSTPAPTSPFSGGIWTAKPWLMAAATVSAVVLVGYGFWQHNEINQLRQTIGQLSKQAKQPATTGQLAPSTSASDTAAARPLADNQSQEGKKDVLTSADAKLVYQRERDTVYITRYVTVPSRSPVVPPENERPADRSEKTTDQRYAATERSTQTALNQSDDLTNTPKTDAYGEPSTSYSVLRKNTGNSSEITNRPTVAKRAKERRLSDQYAYNQPTKGNYASPDQRTIPSTSATNTGITRNNGVTTTTPTSTESAATDPAESVVSATYELIDLPPVSAPTINWTSHLAQRAKRIRPARTTVVSGTAEQAAPESQPIKLMAGRFRAGVGGELASKVVSAGVFTEVLVGPKKNWSVGIGLSQATYSGKFATDYDFDERMKRDFRKEFARAIDPRRDIFNIDTRTTRIQLPVTIGYRVPLNRSLTLSPTIGTSLNLSNTENATFLCPVLIPRKGYDELSFSNPQPVDLITSVAFGAGMEWQSRHWVVQGSPVLTLPLQADQLPMRPDVNWQTKATVGLRARVLYQF